MDLVDRIRRGDESGVESLYAQLASGVRGRLRSIDPQTVEDRLHEIVVVILETIQSGELRDPRRLMGFVRTVTRRAVSAEIRRAIQQRRFLVTSKTCESVPVRAASPEALVAISQQVDQVLGFLSRLKPRDRAILILFYLKERSPEDICRELKLSPTQFRLCKSRALARCSELAARGK